MKDNWIAATSAQRWLMVLTPILLVTVPPITSALITKTATEDNLNEVHAAQISDIRDDVQDLRDDIRNLRDDIRQLWSSGALNRPMPRPTLVFSDSTATSN